MPVENKQFTRGGIAKNLEIGVDASGITHYKEETVEPEAEYGQTVRSSVVEIRMRFNRDELNGELVEIQTTHAYGRLSTNGKVQKDTIKNYHSPMLTKEADLRGFAMLHGGILKSIGNGKVEAIDGFNGLKLFDPVTGVWQTYTLEQETAPPTFDYYPAPEPPTEPTPAP